MKLEQPIRMKNNGQINIVFNAENRKALQKDLPIKEILVQEIPHQHVALKEIEDELKSLVGMEEMKRMIKEIYAWIYINKKREAKGLKSW